VAGQKDVKETMFKLSYSLNSADLLPIEEVCESLSKFGYSGVELSFQRRQFDPLSISEARVEELRDYFASALIKPVCISTATTKFLSNIPHEPSLINIQKENRAFRADLIGRGIALAEKIGVPIVSFQSGYLREEHEGLPRQQVMQKLSTEIKKLLAKISGGVTLVIEPEPGMFIETTADAQELICLVNDDRFGLHMDIGHVFCSEENYLEAIRTSAGEAKYIHMADIREGFNVNYSVATFEDLKSLLDQESVCKTATLYDVDDAGLYLFSHAAKKIIVADKNTIKTVGQHFDGFGFLIIDKDYLAKNDQDVKHEIFAYLDSISGVDYQRVFRAYNAVASLRLGNSQQAPAITKTICNTVKGKVHYHDLFGNGKIDYAKTISALIKTGYSGYCTVELYNHASLWRDVAPSSAKFLPENLRQTQSH